MKTSFKISENFEVAHSRVISLIDKLKEISEYEYYVEEYSHILENNQRHIKAYRMDDMFYMNVILHLPPEKRVIATRNIINSFIGMTKIIDTKKMNDEDLVYLNNLNLESVMIDNKILNEIENKTFNKIFDKVSK